MAYRCLHSNSHSSYEEVLTFVSTSLQTLGWTLYDDVSSTDKVFTSAGTNNQFVNAYMRVFISTYLRFEGYMWWNDGTHTGIGKAYSSTPYNYINVKFNDSLVVYGDKDEVTVWAAGDYVNNMAKVFGFVQPYIVGYTTASGISSGSNIIVDVDSTADFIQGADLMIIGSSTEGRDNVELKDVISDTQIELTSTPRAYASGAKIGHYPCTFYCTTASYNFAVNDLCYVCGNLSSSTTDGTSTQKWTVDSRLHNTNQYLDPEGYLNKYVLQIFSVKDNSLPYGIIGYCTNLKYSPLSGLASTGYTQDLYCTGEKYFSGTPTSATSSGIIDIGHSWVTDEFKDKIIVITSGPGLGETRKVLYNNSDTLSIGDLWSTTPDNSSTYEVYTSVYRNFCGYFCINEIIS